MGKNKLARFAANELFSNMLQPSTEECKRGIDLKGKWRSDFFQNEHSLILELGCGKGEYTLGLAQRHPMCNFIGMDIKGARMWHGCKISNEEKMTNVAFLRTRIQFITLCYAQNEVDEIWITFPDPQPKKENKRLTSPWFLQQYRQILKPEGIIHLKTDDTDLYEYTLHSVIEAEGHHLLRATADLYNPNNSHLEVMDIQTFYEQKWLSQGKKIKYLSFQLKKI
ncbi:MAG: tRNA (guanosine(46)-N7)-methyltransferase TrmB [Bacteroidales bacterium]